MSACGRIVCGVPAGSRGEAVVRRAAAVAGPGATIDLVSVAVVPEGAPPRARPEQVDELAAAAVTAAMLGVRSRPRIVGGRTEAEALLACTAGCDLLVLGPGPAAEELALQGGVPLLVAP